MKNSRPCNMSTKKSKYGTVKQGDAIKARSIILKCIEECIEKYIRVGLKVTISVITVYTF